MTIFLAFLSHSWKFCIPVAFFWVAHSFCIPEISAFLLHSSGRDHELFSIKYRDDCLDSTVGKNLCVQLS
jgi:hypothetical protein